MTAHDFTLALAAESHDYAPCERCDEKTWRGDLDDDNVCDWCRAEEADDETP